MLKIRRVNIDDIHQDPENVRLHPEENLDAIRRSLERFGQAQPIVIDKRTGVIIGGNGLHQAMKSLGWTECDVVEYEAKTDAEKRALAIALNRVGETSKWDWKHLTEQLKDLQDSFNLNDLGFSEADLQPLFNANWEPEETKKLEDFSVTGTGDDKEPNNSCEESDSVSDKKMKRLYLSFFGDDAVFISSVVSAYRKKTGEDATTEEAVLAILRAWSDEAE